jgi:hypothetical protein
MPKESIKPERKEKIQKCRALVEYQNKDPENQGITHQNRHT